MTIWNNTGVTRQFALNISGNASFAKRPVPARTTGAVTIFANSSASINVYAFDGSPVTVNVSGSNPSPLAGSITFNAPSAAPPTGAPTPTYRSSDIVANPVPGNPVPGNPVPGNPVPGNPVPGNPVPGNTTIYYVIDYSWTVTPVSQNDAWHVAVRSLTSIRPIKQDYIFQIFVTKPTERYNMANCLQPGNTPLGTLVGHISDPSNPVPGNPVPGNPVPGNPVPGNATLSDILIQNTSFTIESNSSATAPSSTTSSFAALSASSAGCERTGTAGLIGECTLFGPRQLNQVKITVRAYQKTATTRRDLGFRTAPRRHADQAEHHRRRLWLHGPESGLRVHEGRTRPCGSGFRRRLA